MKEKEACTRMESFSTMENFMKAGMKEQGRSMQEQKSCIREVSRQEFMKEKVNCTRMESFSMKVNSTKDNMKEKEAFMSREK